MNGIEPGEEELERVEFRDSHSRPKPFPIRDIDSFQNQIMPRETQIKSNIVIAATPMAAGNHTINKIAFGANCCGYALLMVGQFQCLYSCVYRKKIRSIFGLEPEPCIDWYVHFWCESCALCQEYAELQNRGLVPYKGLKNVFTVSNEHQLDALGQEEQSCDSREFLSHSLLSVVSSSFLILINSSHLAAEELSLSPLDAPANKSTTSTYMWYHISGWLHLCRINQAKKEIIGGRCPKNTL
ncbi:Protein plant cadmium resistance 6 [Apostasia shenzhenica]|uniref:Protein plant cadmium resistance 6 n=1 Tax=Apostasia shenzhenica TaxID=1088818 RepID=A0A2I0AT21_9ASPA|nr:Protein plant cadmium resistance 6 [Apostasia shenzhenica]